MGRRVLVVSPDASRTGAPLVLLQVARHLQSRGLEPTFVFRRGGPLLADFRSVGRVYGTWSVLAGAAGPSAAVPRRALSGALQRLWEGTLPLRLRMRSYDAVFANTLVGGRLLERLHGARGCPLVTHVHELSYLTSQFPADEVAGVVRRTTRFIAASGAVARFLQKDHAVPADRITVVVEPLDIARASADGASREAICEELGVAAGARLVGCCGKLTWRKGYDLFVQVAAQVIGGTDDDVHFVWVGDADSAEEWRRVRHEIAMLGLESRIHFVGPRPNAVPWVRAFDVLALTSREDPFPLVSLEAAFTRTPIVCFAGTGGTADLAAEGCVRAVPYLDVAAMAAGVRELLGGGAAVDALADRAHERVVREHGLEQVATRVAEVLERAIDA